MRSRALSACFVTLSLALLLLAAMPTQVAAQGCAMCRTALGGIDDPLTQAFNRSILFLMLMPFTLTASVGLWFVYMFRRARKQPVLEVLEMGEEHP